LRLHVDVTGARRAGRTGIFGAMTCQRQHHLTGGGISPNPGPGY
jgi:hypothetical protein